jgi:hypothetical protein
MLALFCLRLACGLAGALLLFSPKQLNPRFFRTHFLTILGLACVSAVLLPDGVPRSCMLGGLGVAILLAFLGSLTWSLDGAPAGRLVTVLTALCLAAVLGMASWNSAGEESSAWSIGNDLSSAGLLGAATTAMLIGHSYLIAPSMSLSPLFRSVGAVCTLSLVRAVFGSIGIAYWTQSHSLATLDDVTVLLPLRWGLGILAPLILGGMAWQTARIRSTQSATGILYVVVIFVFLGELISQVLFMMTGCRF